MPVNDNHSEKISCFYELYITIITYLFGNMGMYPNLDIKKVATWTASWEIMKMKKVN